MLKKRLCVVAIIRMANIGQFGDNFKVNISELDGTLREKGDLL